MAKIDTIGTFRGRVLQSGVGLSKNGFPQWNVILVATEKYIEHPTELQHFGLDAPAWVDYSEFDQQIEGYFVLFNDKENYVESKGNDNTATRNYQQLKLATGWTGQSFDDLSNDSLLDKQVLFRTDENDYNNKITIKVVWIDAYDAPPNRTLKSVDASELKAMNAKLKAIKPPIQATKASAPGANTGPRQADLPERATLPANQKVPPGRTPTEFDLLTPTEFDLPTETTTTPPKRGRKPAAAKEDNPGCTREEAWEYLQSVKGDNGDDELADAWQSAIGEVAPDVDDDEKITPTQWAKVRDIVVKDMDLQAVA